MLIKKEGNTSIFGRTDKVTVDAFLNALKEASILTGDIVVDYTATHTEEKKHFENKTPAEVKALLTELDEKYIALDIIENIR